MKIKSLMVSKPITVTIRKTIPQALELMKLNAIRHLPVVDSKKNLKGLLTLADLKQALIPSMLAEFTLSDMMIKNPITISPDSDVEIAAQLIYKHKIGGFTCYYRSKTGRYHYRLRPFARLHRYDGHTVQQRPD